MSLTIGLQDRHIFVPSKYLPTKYNQILPHKGVWFGSGDTLLNLEPLSLERVKTGSLNLVCKWTVVNTSQRIIAP